MTRLSKWVLAGLVLAVGLGAAGWGAWRALGNGRDTVTFRTVPVERGDLLATIRATGTMQPEEVIDVGAQIPGRIVRFGVDPSDANRATYWNTPVHAGTLLAQLDDSLFKARVEQMKAALGEADALIQQAEASVQKTEADLEQLKARLAQFKRDYDRALAMRPIRAIADVEYDAAVMNYDTSRASLTVGQASVAQARASALQTQKARVRAEANLREAEINLGYTRIVSPVEGVIIERRVNVGQTVVAATTAPSLFLIAKDLKRLQIWVSVNEADIGNIHDGQKAVFTVDAYPKERFVGQVAQTRLNATMTNNVVTYTVVVDTDNASLRLKPYMTANVEFEIAHKQDVLQVPNAALRWTPKPSSIVPEARTAFISTRKGNPDEAVVWVADGAMVRPITVKIGMSDGAQTEIGSTELDAGTEIVIGATKARSNDDSGGSPFAPKMFGGGKKS